MSPAYTQCLFIGLFLINFAKGKGICPITDSKCLTKGAAQVHDDIVRGKEGLFEPLDPLHLEEIRGELPFLKYQLNQATLEGLKDCKIYLQYPESLAFDYRLFCPKLIIKTRYESEGKLNGLPMDGKGQMKIIANDYNILFTGTYAKYISEEDQTLRIFLPFYNLKTEPKGKITIESDTMSDQTKTYLNTNWQVAEIFFRNPMLDKFMAKYMSNLNIFLRAHRLEDMTPKED